ncbi:hypothetical protein EON63_21630 [archaeon]|nr:MAG: hypothetical protein EON63_21630 [archaeon]
MSEVTEDANVAKLTLSYFYYVFFTITLVTALFVLCQATVVVMFGPTMALKGSSDEAVKYAAGICVFMCMCTCVWVSVCTCVYVYVVCVSMNAVCCRYVYVYGCVVAGNIRVYVCLHATCKVYKYLYALGLCSVCTFACMFLNAYDFECM